MNVIGEYWRNSTVAEKLFAAGLLVFFVFIPLHWDIAKNGMYFAVLVALVSLVADRHRAPRLSGVEWLLFAVIVAYLAQSALSLWVNEIPEHGYVHLKSRQAKLLLLIPLYLFVRKHGMSYGLFLVLVAVGAVVAGGSAIADLIASDFKWRLRVAGGGDRIFPYVAAATTFTVLLWTGGISSIGTSRLRAGLLLVASFFSLAGVVLSASRGAWLALIGAFLMIVAGWQSRLSAKEKTVLLIIVLAIVLPLSQVPYFKQRIANAGDRIAAYVHDEDGGTNSVSTRFELWRIAWRLGLENPVMGVGPGGFDATVRSDLKVQSEAEFYSRFEYPHNEYLAALASRGFPGLLLLLAVLLVPAWIFFSGWRCDDEKRRVIAFSGLMVIAVFAVSCLTYDHLSGRRQMSVYATVVGVLLGMLMHRVRAGAKPYSAD